MIFGDIYIKNICLKKTSVRVPPHDDGTGECAEAVSLGWENKTTCPPLRSWRGDFQISAASCLDAKTGFHGNQWREREIGDAGKLMHGVFCVFKKGR